MDRGHGSGVVGDMFADSMIDAWNFLGQCGLVLEGNAARTDAEHMLTLFANQTGLSMQEGGDEVNGQMMWLEPMDPDFGTLWWSETNGRFYLGILGDTQGSLST